MSQYKANNEKFFRRSEIQEMTANAYPRPWYDFEDEITRYQTVEIVWEDGTTTSGKITHVEFAHVGSFRDLVDVWEVNGSKGRIYVGFHNGPRVFRRYTEGWHQKVVQAVSVKFCGLKA